MSDIVNMLRQGEKEGVDGWWSTMAEAADEIEHLRAQNASMRRTYGSDPIFNEKQAEIGRLGAENGLLRSKITQVESLLENGAFGLALEAIRVGYVE